MTFVGIHGHELWTEMFAERRRRRRKQNQIWQGSTRFNSPSSTTHGVRCSRGIESNFITQIITFSSKIFQWQFPSQFSRLTFSPLSPYYQIPSSNPKLHQPRNQSILFRLRTRADELTWVKSAIRAMYSLASIDLKEHIEQKQWRCSFSLSYARAFSYRLK